MNVVTLERELARGPSAVGIESCLSKELIIPYNSIQWLKG